MIPDFTDERIQQMYVADFTNEDVG